MNWNRFLWRKKPVDETAYTPSSQQRRKSVLQQSRNVSGSGGFQVACDAAFNANLREVKAWTDRHHSAKRKTEQDQLSQILISAARSKKTHAVKKMVAYLIEKGANPNYQDASGQTALHWVCRGGDHSTVEYLLNHAKADPSLQDRLGLTALHWASRCGHLEIVRLLLGSTSMLPSFRFSRNMLNTSLVSAEERDSDGRTALHLAVMERHKDVVGLLLSEMTNVDIQDNNGLTPLHHACQLGDAVLVALLGAHGCNPNVRNVWGRTPFHEALQAARDPSVFEALLEFPCVYLNIRDDHGVSAMDEVLFNGQCGLLQLVIDYHTRSFFSNRSTGSALVEIVRKRCPTFSLREVEFLPVTTFLEFGKIPFFEELKRTDLLKAEMLQPNQKVLFICNQWDNLNLAPASNSCPDPIGRQYKCIHKFLKQVQNIDFIWLQQACLADSSPEMLQENLPSLLLAAFLATDVLVVPGAKTQISGNARKGSNSSKKSLYYSDLRALSRSVKCRTELLLGILSGSNFFFALETGTVSIDAPRNSMGGFFHSRQSVKEPERVTNTPSWSAFIDAECVSLVFSTVTAEALSLRQDRHSEEGKVFEKFWEAEFLELEEFLHLAAGTVLNSNKNTARKIAEFSLSDEELTNLLRSKNPELYTLHEQLITAEPSLTKQSQAYTQLLLAGVTYVTVFLNAQAENESEPVQHSKLDEKLKKKSSFLSRLNSACSQMDLNPKKEQEKSKPYFPKTLMINPPKTYDDNSSEPSTPKHSSSSAPGNMWTKLGGGQGLSKEHAFPSLNSVIQAISHIRPISHYLRWFVPMPKDSPQRRSGGARVPQDWLLNAVDSPSSNSSSSVAAPTKLTHNWENRSPLAFELGSLISNLWQPKSPDFFSPSLLSVKDVAETMKLQHKHDSPLSNFSSDLAVFMRRMGPQDWFQELLERLHDELCFMAPQIFEPGRSLYTKHQLKNGSELSAQDVQDTEVTASEVANSAQPFNMDQILEADELVQTFQSEDCASPLTPEDAQTPGNSQVFYEQSIITDLFEGALSFEFTCPDCSCIWSKEENFFQVSVPIKEQTEIESMKATTRKYLDSPYNSDEEHMDHGMQPIKVDIAGNVSSVSLASKFSFRFSGRRKSSDGQIPSSSLSFSHTTLENAPSSRERDGSASSNSKEKNESGVSKIRRAIHRAATSSSEEVSAMTDPPGILELSHQGRDHSDHSIKVSTPIPEASTEASTPVKKATSPTPMESLAPLDWFDQTQDNERKSSSTPCSPTKCSLQSSRGKCLFPVENSAQLFPFKHIPARRSGSNAALQEPAVVLANKTSGSVRKKRSSSFTALKISPISFHPRNKELLPPSIPQQPGQEMSSPPSLQSVSRRSAGQTPQERTDNESSESSRFRFSDTSLEPFTDGSPEQAESDVKRRKSTLSHLRLPLSPQTRSQKSQKIPSQVATPQSASRRELSSRSFHTRSDGLCTGRSVQSQRRGAVKAVPLSLHDCLIHFCRGQETKVQAFTCTSCNSSRATKTRSSFKYLPEILVIHINRIQQNQTFKSKIATVVEFPLDSLDMTPYFDDSGVRAVRKHTQGADERGEPGILYDLVALIKHSGGVNDSQYITYARTSNKDCWIVFNNEKVFTVTAADVMREQAFMLFYQRKNPGSNRTKDLKMLHGMRESSQKLFGLSYPWYLKWKHTFDPGPILNHDLVCKHFRIKPNKGKLSNCHFVHISPQRWALLQEKYGPPGSTNESRPLKEAEVCTECSQLHKQLISQRQAERQAVIQRDDTGSQTSPPWYIINMEWLNQWREYVTAGSEEDLDLVHRPPGPIDNFPLLENSQSSLPTQEKERNRPYRAVNKQVWEYLHDKYGGGPAIVREKESLHSPEVLTK